MLVRDRKDPRCKSGNDQRVPLLDATGFDALALLDEQRAATVSRGRVFPYNARSVGTAFRWTCRALKIIDLHFHDLGHEATSRMFEAGLDIPRVSLVTGHKDWKMLRRYANLRDRLEKACVLRDALFEGSSGRRRVGEHTTFVMLRSKLACVSKHAGTRTRIFKRPLSPSDLHRQLAKAAPKPEAGSAPGQAAFAAAMALIVEDTALDGAPRFRGTAVPIRPAAELSARGVSEAALLSDFVMLTPEMLVAARVYYALAGSNHRIALAS